jgi:hypothetical protein
VSLRICVDADVKKSGWRKPCLCACERRCRADLISASVTRALIRWPAFSVALQQTGSSRTYTRAQSGSEGRQGMKTWRIGARPPADGKRGEGGRPLPMRCVDSRGRNPIPQFPSWLPQYCSRDYFISPAIDQTAPRRQYATEPPSRLGPRGNGSLGIWPRGVWAQTGTRTMATGTTSPYRRTSDSR